MKLYRVLRQTNPPRGKREILIEASGLPWENATALRDKLQREENEKHPERSSWTKDLFECELQKEE